MIGYFNGNNKTLWVMLQGLIQTLCVRLPFAYFMSIQPNASLTRIGLAAPVSTTVGILLNVGFYLYLNKKEKTRLTARFFYASDLEYAFFIWLLSSNNTLSSVSSVSFCSIAAISAFACCRSAFLTAGSCSAAKRAS